jgi:hypothetical protein
MLYILYHIQSLFKILAILGINYHVFMNNQNINYYFDFYTSYHQFYITSDNLDSVAYYRNDDIAADKVRCSPFKSLSAILNWPLQHFVKK